MKKLISLLLVICMLCPMFVGCANQDENYKMKKKYLRQFKIEDKEPEDVIIDYDGGTYNGARIVMLDAEYHAPKENSVIIDDDIIINYYDSNKLYVYRRGRFYSFTDAISRSILSREDVQDVALKFNAAVTNYTDTCDKHDFDLCEVDLRYYNLGDRHLKSNAIMINIDRRIIFGGKIDEKQLLVEYINSRFGANVIKEIGFHYIQTSKSLLCKVFIEDVRLENLPQFMKELSRVPGLLWIGCYSRRFYPEI